MAKDINTPGEREHGALDAFLNLLSLITLVWLTTAVVSMFFQIIEKFWGVDYGYSRDFTQSGLKFAIASSLIIMPVYLGLMAYLHHLYKVGRLNHASGVARWLTYLMLLVSALFIIGSLINIIFQFLNGTYTPATILKVLVVLAVAGGIFGYYWYDLRRSDYRSRSKVSVALAVAVVVVTLGGIVGSLFIVDSPRVTRLKNADLKRVEHLAQLNVLLNYEYQNTGKLPTDLSAGQFDRFRDPVSNEPYSYQPLGDKQYELCATFARKVEAVEDDRRYYGTEPWHYHGQGYECFSQTISDTESRVKSIPSVPVE